MLRSHAQVLQGGLWPERHFGEVVLVLVLQAAALPFGQPAEVEGDDRANTRLRGHLVMLPSEIFREAGRAMHEGHRESVLAIGRDVPDPDLRILWGEGVLACAYALPQALLVPHAGRRSLRQHPLRLLRISVCPHVHAGQKRPLGDVAWARVLQHQSPIGAVIARRHQADVPPIAHPFAGAAAAALARELLCVLPEVHVVPQPHPTAETALADVDAVEAGSEELEIFLPPHAAAKALLGHGGRRAPPQRHRPSGALLPHGAQVGRLSRGSADFREPCGGMETRGRDHAGRQRLQEGVRNLRDIIFRLGLHIFGQCPPAPREHSRNRA
mmetsp:Transcript_119921/g.344591  ORF Transcript_119921/g.344591 Transcript_119921/m.344591 type:complete len:327 (-) Transcript_119921:276-1256(-)